MSDKKKQKKGGLGKKILGLVVVLGIGVAAAFYFAPDTMQAQLASLRSMLGV